MEEKEKKESDYIWIHYERDGGEEGRNIKHLPFPPILTANKMTRMEGMKMKCSSRFFFPFSYLIFLNKKNKS